jgi:hypothetical protein
MPAANVEFSMLNERVLCRETCNLYWLASPLVGGLVYRSENLKPLRASGRAHCPDNMEDHLSQVFYTGDPNVTCLAPVPDIAHSLCSWQTHLHYVVAVIFF